jgi:alkaline phosphatase D
MRRTHESVYLTLLSHVRVRPCDGRSPAGAAGFYFGRLGGNVRKLLLPAMLVLVSVLAAPAAAGAVQFPDGVASGDVTSTRAVLWTRVDVAGNIKVEIFGNAALHPPKIFQRNVKTSSVRDFTIKVDASGLRPNKQYWYRFRKDRDASAVGTFKTAPSVSTPADVKAAYTGDSDVTRVNGVPAVNDFQVLQALQAGNPDFWVYLGDTIYADSSFRPGGPAMTLAEYRATYREGRTYPNLTNLLASTSTYPTWDDHEVVNDYQGATVDPARYAAARQAFFENMPIRETGLLHDASCVGDPIYRKYSWGKDADLFMLDERACRSAEAVAACSGDLAPTLPQSLRQQFPFNQFLSPTPPEGCLTALNNPSRTMLGPVQKAQFEQDLLNSTARYKLIVSQDPIQQFFVLPYDRWEGYPAERSEILNFIRNNGIDKTLFLTTDTHATLQNHVFVDRFTDPGTISDEMVTGPIATTTFQNEVIGAAGFFGLLAVNLALDQTTGMQCRNLNRNSYATVDVTSGGTTTITSRDETGNPVIGVNTTGRPLPCTGTYGP